MYFYIYIYFYICISIVIYTYVHNDLSCSWNLSEPALEKMKRFRKIFKDHGVIIMVESNLQVTM